MIRLVSAPLGDFEKVVRAAGQRDRVLKGATYPPGCSLAGGTVTFRAPDGRAPVELRVRPCEYTGSATTVRPLFEQGVMQFATVNDLFEFCNIDLAGAFGTTVADEGARRTPPPPSYVDPDALTRAFAAMGHRPGAAVRQVAEVVAAHAACPYPKAPASICLLDPDESHFFALRALPDLLSEFGTAPHVLCEFDCRELASEAHAAALLGVPRGYIGFDPSPPLVAALQMPRRPILVLNGVEHAHEAVLTRSVLGLIETGSLRAPDGTLLRRPDCSVIVTSRLEPGLLRERLGDVPVADRQAIQSACRDHLVQNGALPELVTAISRYVVNFVSPAELETAADVVIRALAREYGLQLDQIDPVLIRAVVDIAGVRGAPRSLRGAAWDALAPTFARAAASRFSGRLRLMGGPPPQLSPVSALEQSDRDASTDC